MSFDLPRVINAIKSIAPTIVKQALDQASRNEAIIRILKELNLDPMQPPDNVEGVYNIALVEYGVDKPEPILNLFKEKEIKNAFWQAYTNNSPLRFLNKVENFIESNILGDEIRKLPINITSALEEFGQVFIDVAKKTNSTTFQPYPDWNMDYSSGGLETLIKEKNLKFCGRRFVFDAFKKFLNENPNGYFTLLGAPGMGKSTIAAKYIDDHKALYFFNIRAQGINRPETFLSSIRQQLIKRYQLEKAEKDDLPTLLEKASQKLLSGERLVIVVDALDEVEQSGSENLLHLPIALPYSVYFLLTRRPYTIENQRFNVSPDLPVEELDLREYGDLSREDIKEYIRLTTAEPEHKDKLNKWMKNCKITFEQFVEQVADKSENNFMYLRYVLPAIAGGSYKDIKQLPVGLQEYYQTQWKRMGMDSQTQEKKVMILFILTEIGRAIPREMIADIAQQDIDEVQKVLDELLEYLRKEEIEGEICYSIEHTSFLDFLKAQQVVDSKCQLFQEVHKSIVAYWERVYNLI